jgi:hypothetical protein
MFRVVASDRLVFAQFATTGNATEMSHPYFIRKVVVRNYAPSAVSQCPRHDIFDPPFSLACRIRPGPAAQVSIGEAAERKFKAGRRISQCQIAARLVMTG